MTFCSKKEFLIKRFIDHVFHVLWSINLLLILRRNFWLLAPGDGAKEKLLKLFNFDIEFVVMNNTMFAEPPSPWLWTLNIEHEHTVVKILHTIRILGSYKCCCLKGEVARRRLLGHQCQTSSIITQLRRENQGEAAAGQQVCRRLHEDV